MIVADASVVVPALSLDGRAGRVARAAIEADDVGAPQLLVAEVLHAARRLNRDGLIAEARGTDVARSLRRTPIKLYGLRLVAERMWSLRANVATYDAAYVALAEVLECELVTADRRLASAPGLRCEVRVLS